MSCRSPEEMALLLWSSLGVKAAWYSRDTSSGPAPGTAVIQVSGLKHQSADSGLLNGHGPSVREQKDRRQPRDGQEPMRQFWSP